MSKPKNAAPAPTAPEPVDWTGTRTQRVEYKPEATIFAQGDPATSVMYVEQGNVRLSVLSHTGKEAVVAVLEVAHFFGEGCLAGQSQRMATATAMAACTIVVVDKPEMVRQLHARPAFADRFLTHMLTRNIRIEDDLIDSCSTPPKNGWHERCCCCRVTVSQTHLTGHCREWRRRRLPRWWARHARA